MTRIRYAAVMVEVQHYWNSETSHVVHLLQYAEGYPDAIAQSLRLEHGSQFTNILRCYSQVEEDKDERAARRINDTVMAEVERVKADLVNGGDNGEEHY